MTPVSQSQILGKLCNGHPLGRSLHGRAVSDNAFDAGTRINERNLLENPLLGSLDSSVDAAVSCTRDDFFKILAETSVMRNSTQLTRRVPDDNSAFFLAFFT